MLCSWSELVVVVTRAKERGSLGFAGMGACSMRTVLQLNLCVSPVGGAASGRVPSRRWPIAPHIPVREVTDTTDPELIRTLNAVWSYEPVSPTAPIFDDPDLDAIVRQYASRHQVMHLSMQRLLACRGDWGGKHCLVGHCVAVSV